MRSRRPSLRLSIASLVAVGLLATSVVPVGAQPEIDVEDRLDRSGLEQAEAERQALEADLQRRAERLDEIEMEVSAVVEDYNEAVVALETVEAERALTLEELTGLEAEVTQLSGIAAEHVRRLHKLGGPGVELAAVFVSGNATDAGARSATLKRLLNAQLLDLEALAAARASVEAAEARLADQEAEASARADEVEAQRIETEATLAAFQAEIAELEDDLATAERRQAQEQAALDAERDRLIAEERARIAAEEQARREAEERERRAAEQREREQRERERAAQQSAPAPSPAPTSGGGSGGSSTGGSSQPAPPPPPPAPSTRRSAQVAVDTALAQVGKPYRWGATGPNSFDCSGLTSYAWRAAGVTIPRTSRAQYAGLTKVSRADLQPGDLVFYNNPISHVAMYIGGDRIVEAPYTGASVRVRSLSGRSPVGYARP
jgi:peptidoglycan DL-endopeptidase CwlO